MNRARLRFSPFLTQAVDDESSNAPVPLHVTGGPLSDRSPVQGRGKGHLWLACKCLPLGKRFGRCDDVRIVGCLTFVFCFRPCTVCRLRTECTRTVSMDYHQHGYEHGCDHGEFHMPVVRGLRIATGKCDKYSPYVSSASIIKGQRRYRGLRCRPSRSSACPSPSRLLVNGALGLPAETETRQICNRYYRDIYIWP